MGRDEIDIRRQISIAIVLQAEDLDFTVSGEFEESIGIRGHAAIGTPGDEDVEVLIAVEFERQFNLG
jgi:hypothetical protein